MSTYGPFLTASGIGQEGLLALVPSRGGDAGTVTVSVFGVGLTSGSGARLVKAGQADIVGSAAVAAADGRSLVTVFDLSGHTLGAYNFVLTTPAGTSIALVGAFTVEAAEKPKVVGRSDRSLADPGRGARTRFKWSTATRATLMHQPSC